MLYSDTDSLIVSKRGYDLLTEQKLIHDEELGKLKVEKKLIFFNAISPKTYIAQDTEGKVDIKCKGMGGFLNLSDDKKLKLWHVLLTTGIIKNEKM